MSKEKISTEGDFDSERGSDESWNYHRQKIMEEFGIGMEEDEE